MSGSKFGGSILSELHPSSWVVPAEMPVKSKKSKQNLRIGVPKESYFFENRVALTPEAVGVLVANGHDVYVQKGAGEPSSYPDGLYNAAGAHIVYSLADVYIKSDTIVKIAPLSSEELDMLRPQQALLSAVNLGSLTPHHLKTLIRKNILALGFEFLEGPKRNRPLVQIMSEIAGITSVHIASELLSAHTQGKGMLLGGVAGVPPSIVTIIGAGTVGYNAAMTALGMGATIKIIDEDVGQLRLIEARLGQKVHSVVSMHNYIEEAVLSSDVVIGAAFKPGHRAPVVVTEDMVMQMKEGSVIVDVAIDQGGCVDTSSPTTHEKPTFVKHDVVHYCVPNIAARVPATASAAVSNILGPLLIQAGDFGGLEQLMKSDDGVRKGVYVYRKHLTKRTLSTLFGIDFMDINLLVASGL